MSDLRRIFGTSLMTVLLVMWGLFMVCSGRVPDVNYDDELFGDDADFAQDYNQSGNSELISGPRLTKVTSTGSLTSFLAE